MRLLIVLALSIWGAGGLSKVVAQPVCGASPEQHCNVGSGTYRIALPESADAPGAMIWLHGWGGSADAVMRNTGMAARLAERNMALVAPNGLVTSPERNNNRNWSVNDGRTYMRDDIAFLREVVDDVVARHGIARERILLGGFSRGGSMVWDAACRTPDLARAYAPVAGAFWEPMFQDCEGPVDLFHTHGWTDRTVPLEGRPLRGGAMTQGDVFQSLYILRDTNGCTNRQPQTAPISESSDRWMRSWSDCDAGRIDMMLHPGGHGIPKGWLAETLNWFEARLAESCETVAARQPDGPTCG